MGVCGGGGGGGGNTVVIHSLSNRQIIGHDKETLRGSVSGHSPVHGTTCAKEKGARGHTHC